MGRIEGSSSSFIEQWENREYCDAVITCGVGRLLPIIITTLVEERCLMDEPNQPKVTLEYFHVQLKLILLRKSIGIDMQMVYTNGTNYHSVL